MSKAMARKLLRISEGDKFHDCLNNREIEVDYIYDRGRVARCTVFDHDDGDLINEHYQLFTLEELLHFEEV